MSKQGLSEERAYKSMRKLAMDSGQPLVVVAENIIQILTLEVDS